MYYYRIEVLCRFGLKFVEGVRIRTGSTFFTLYFLIITSFLYFFSYSFRFSVAIYLFYVVFGGEFFIFPEEPIAIVVPEVLKD